MAKKASSTAEKPTRAKKPKQGFLPDLAPPSIPAIDDAADIYYDAMQDRVKLSKEEHEAKDNLIDKMKEHGQSIYTTRHGLVVTIVNKSNVKCKKKGDGESEGDEE